MRSLPKYPLTLVRKTQRPIRDLFKGIYQVFIPRKLHHALGEVYTPDWLAAYVLERIEWKPENELLDPTCGTGTFVLEALKRHLVEVERTANAGDILDGIFGIDLSPLAVLAAKASIVITLASRFERDNPVTLPIFLADAINVAKVDKADIFHHRLQTELGPQPFAVPGALARSGLLHTIFAEIRRYITSGMNSATIWEQVKHKLEDLALDQGSGEALRKTISTLCELHEKAWDGIWCSILADRFAAAAIGKRSHVVGNPPPWVKWSHLPPEYAKFIKPLCLELNVFSVDRYVGGIESDISTVIATQAALTWLRRDGTLALLITATLFANESSQGFRRMEMEDGEPIAGFQYVEDFKAIAPFDGVVNHPSLMVLKRGVVRNTRYHTGCGSLRREGQSPSSRPANFFEGLSRRSWRRHLFLGRMPARGFEVRLMSSACGANCLTRNRAAHTGRGRASRQTLTEHSLFEHWSFERIVC